MDRLSRKELKTDKFAQEVEHTVEFVGEHRKQAILYSAIVIAVILIGAGIYFYRGHQHTVRQAALAEAVQVQQGTVGPSQNPLAKSYATQAEKDKAAQAAFADVAAKYNGSEEAAYATYMLANIAMDQGRVSDAEKQFKAVVDMGHPNYASLAKVSLADIYASQGKMSEAEQLLRSLMDKPTALISKEQATIELAKLLANKRPDEARKLLEPLRASDRAAVSRAAITELGQLSAPRK